MHTDAIELVLPRKREQAKWQEWWKPWLTYWPRQKIMADIFRLTACIAGFFQIAFFPNVPGYNAADLTPILMAGGLYTVLKIAQPFRWQQVRAINISLLALDIAAAGLLVHFTGGLHTPFILYTLVPVLSSALVKDYLLTVIISAITAAYVLASYIYNPISSYITTAQAVNDFLVYMIALSLVASLPYAFNLRLAHRLQSQGATEERRRISRELHDGVCQTLYGLRWQVQGLSKHVSTNSQLSSECQTIEMSLDTAEQDARGLLEVMRSLDDANKFLPNVRHYLEHLKHYAGISYQLECGETIALSEAAELEATMICVEALANVKKHAAAKNVTVSVRRVHRHVQIKIADDGCGFDYRGESDHKSHGLAIMRERAESIGGTLRVTSAIGQGTEMFVELPIHRAEAIW